MIQNTHAQYPSSLSNTIIFYFISCTARTICGASERIERGQKRLSTKSSPPPQNANQNLWRRRCIFLVCSVFVLFIRSLLLGSTSLAATSKTLGTRAGPSVQSARDLLHEFARAPVPTHAARSLIFHSQCQRSVFVRFGKRARYSAQQFGQQLFRCFVNCSGRRVQFILPLGAFQSRLLVQYGSYIFLSFGAACFFSLSLICQVLQPSQTVHIIVPRDAVVFPCAVHQYGQRSVFIKLV